MYHIHTITRLIEVSREYKKPFCLTFIDLKKAFDSVETEAVMGALTNQALPTPYIKILRELYRNFTTKIIPFYKDIIINGKVRSATWTLVFVCLLYLLSNLLNVIVTAWEFIDMQTLQTEFYAFYMFSTDLVSLLVVTACAMRLPIYMLCNPELRHMITTTMKLHLKPKIERCKIDYM
ncbi:hypothetical protein DICVIV_05022 [Dictyocaulus viviparus]|uniref:Reverse transcriptase domain-containing protein n=1 Tax=Dictyocaulus viviparus TaxID=29172 RepID=A0A0D8XYD1_DICVI|nr:hypothetical protein DICVIV_05022 [Dictyocaulus viviparus]